MRLIKLTHAGFRAHVKIAFRIVSLCGRTKTTTPCRRATRQIACSESGLTSVAVASREAGLTDALTSVATALRCVQTATVMCALSTIQALRTRYMHTPKQHTKYPTCSCVIHSIGLLVYPAGYGFLPIMLRNLYKSTFSPFHF